MTATDTTGGLGAKYVTTLTDDEREVVPHRLRGTVLGIKADAFKIGRTVQAERLVELLVEHSVCHNHRGYASGCDGCDLAVPEPEYVGDTTPLTRWAEHIAALAAEGDA